MIMMVIICLVWGDFGLGVERVLFSIFKDIRENLLIKF